MTSPTNPQRSEHGWHQVSLCCPDWHAAEQMAVHHLGPRLARTERAGLLVGWWFIRKDSCWRVRYQPCPGQEESARAAVGELVRELAADGHVGRWALTLYEPEAHAFGGHNGMDSAHALFHADSHHLLAHLRRTGDRHRSELGVLLTCALMHGAAQDWYEQGDIFAQVAAHRVADRPPTDTEVDAVRRLLAARTTSIDWEAAWRAAFRDAGAALAGLAHAGLLTRGLRAVLTHHVLFAWNRAGIPAHQQALLAHAAAHAVFKSETRPPVAEAENPAHDHH